MHLTLTHPRTHPPIHSRTHSPTHPLSHPLTHPFTYTHPPAGDPQQQTVPRRLRLLLVRPLNKKHPLAHSRTHSLTLTHTPAGDPQQQPVPRRLPVQHHPQGQLCGRGAQPAGHQRLPGGAHGAAGAGKDHHGDTQPAAGRGDTHQQVGRFRGVFFWGGSLGCRGLRGRGNDNRNTQPAAGRADTHQQVGGCCSGV